MTKKTELEEMFRDRVGRIWSNGDAVLENTRFGFRIQEQKWLAGLKYVGGRPRAVGDVVCTHPSRIIVLLSPRLLEEDREVADKIMGHEAVHVGCPRHDGNFCRLAEKHNLPRTERMAHGGGVEVRYKRIDDPTSGRYKPFRAFESVSQALKYLDANGHPKLKYKLVY